MKTFGFKLRPPIGCEATWHALYYTGATCFDLLVCDKFVSRLQGFERGRNKFLMHVQEVGPEEQHDVCLWRYEDDSGPTYVVDVRTQPPFETFFPRKAGDRFAAECFPGQDKVFLRVILSHDN